MSRIAINTQLDPERSGGVETNLLSMLRMVETTPRDIKIALLAPPVHASKFRSRVTSMEVIPWEHGREVYIGPAVRGRRIRRLLGSRANYFDAFVGVYRRARYGKIVNTSREEIDKILAPRGIGAIHFPTPHWFDTSLPYLYEPWDLQHLHFPDFFSDEEVLARERLYRQGCAHAAMILTATQWVKDDIVKQYQIAPEKIVVLRRSSFGAHNELNDAQVRHQLNTNAIPADFIFFPAMTFEHKNHIRLLKALARLRDGSNVRVNLVLSGREHHPHGQAVKRAVRELGLGEQVLLLGEVSDDLLAALYQSARFLIFPSLFEGLGLPLLEAFRHRLPVVAARATAIPEVVGDAALLFDGTDVENIARVIAEALRHPEKMQDLASAGQERLEAFSWQRSLPLLMACYKRVLGERLTEQEEADLASATL